MLNQAPEIEHKCIENSNCLTFIVSNGMSTVASCFCPKPRGSDDNGGMRDFPFCRVIKLWHIGVDYIRMIRKY
jgi:hypothetical protein